MKYIFAKLSRNGSFILKKNFLLFGVVFIHLVLIFGLKADKYN